VVLCEEIGCRVGRKLSSLRGQWGRSIDLVEATHVARRTCVVLYEYTIAFSDIGQVAVTGNRTYPSGPLALVAQIPSL
jgi:hypothetical protein